MANMRTLSMNLIRAGLIGIVAMAPGIVEARQHRATFLFLDESGQTRQETLINVRYVYVDRRLLNTNPPKGSSPETTPLPYRDRPIRRRSLLLQNSRISFNVIRSIQFVYRGAGTVGTEQLILRLTMTDGSKRDVPSSDLRGFAGATSPYLEGRIDKESEPIRFELPPFRREAEQADSGLEKVFFHHGRRR